MELTNRQEEIIAIVQNFEPISADIIAEKLKLSKSTIRSDLAVLATLGILEARTKVGYIYQGQALSPIVFSNLYRAEVSSIMSEALLVEGQMTIQDAITSLFRYDSGSLFIENQDNDLIGIVSRKDLLRFLLAGNPDLNTPVAVIMTRMPNVIVAFEDDKIYQAAHLLQLHEIDSMPIVSRENPHKVVGKVSKTNILNHYIHHFPDKEVN